MYLKTAEESMSLPAGATSRSVPLKIYPVISTCDSDKDDDLESLEQQVHLLSPIQYNEEDEEDSANNYLNDEEVYDDAFDKILKGDNSSSFSPQSSSENSEADEQPRRNPSTSSSRCSNEPYNLSFSDKARLFAKLSVPNIPSTYPQDRKKSKRARNMNRTSLSQLRGDDVSNYNFENIANIERKHEKHATHFTFPGKENSARTDKANKSYTDSSPRHTHYILDNPATRAIYLNQCSPETRYNQKKISRTAFAGRLGKDGFGSRSEKRKIVRTWTGGADLVSPSMVMGYSFNAATVTRNHKPKKTEDEKLNRPTDRKEGTSLPRSVTREPDTAKRTAPTHSRITSRKSSPDFESLLPKLITIHSPFSQGSGFSNTFNAVSPRKGHQRRNTNPDSRTDCANIDSKIAGSRQSPASSSSSSSHEKEGMKRGHKSLPNPSKISMKSNVLGMISAFENLKIRPKTEARYVRVKDIKHPNTEHQNGEVQMKGTEINKSEQPKLISRNAKLQTVESDLKGKEKISRNHNCNAAPAVEQTNEKENKQENARTKDISSRRHKSHGAGLVFEELTRKQKHEQDNAKVNNISHNKWSEECKDTIAKHQKKEKTNSSENSSRRHSIKNKASRRNDKHRRHKSDDLSALHKSPLSKDGKNTIESEKRRASLSITSPSCSTSSHKTANTSPSKKFLQRCRKSGDLSALMIPSIEEGRERSYASPSSDSGSSHDSSQQTAQLIASPTKIEIHKHCDTGDLSDQLSPEQVKNSEERNTPSSTRKSRKRTHHRNHSKSSQHDQLSAEVVKNSREKNLNDRVSPTQGEQSAHNKATHRKNEKEKRRKSHSIKRDENNQVSGQQSVQSKTSRQTTPSHTRSKTYSVLPLDGEYILPPHRRHKSYASSSLDEDESTDRHHRQSFSSMVEEPMPSPSGCSRTQNDVHPNLRHKTVTTPMRSPRRETNTPRRETNTPRRETNMPRQETHTQGKFFFANNKIQAHKHESVKVGKSSKASRRRTSFQPDSSRISQSNEQVITSEGRHSRKNKNSNGRSPKYKCHPTRDSVDDYMNKRSEKPDNNESNNSDQKHLLDGISLMDSSNLDESYLFYCVESEKNDFDFALTEALGSPLSICTPSIPPPLGDVFIVSDKHQEVKTWSSMDPTMATENESVPMKGDDLSNLSDSTILPKKKGFNFFKFGKKTKKESGGEGGVDTTCGCAVM